MAAVPVAQRMTAEEFKALPEIPDDPRILELVEGKLVVHGPTGFHGDVGAKKAAYERHGLPELWLVDTQADVVLVFRRSSSMVESFDVALELDREAALTSPLLPGFELALAELFPRE